MAFVLSAFHIVIILSIGFLFWRKETFLEVLFWPCLLIKLLAGIILGLLYTYYFPAGDTFSYFKDATLLASVAKVDFPAYLIILFSNAGVELLSLDYYEPRALFLTKITSVFSLITFNNYWIISLYFSLISFFGAWYLVTMINRRIRAVTLPSVIAFLLWPSLVFWSSGLIKETLAIAAMYYLTAMFIKIWFNERMSIPQIILAGVSLGIFWSLKYYFAAAFIPVVLTTILYKVVNRSGFVRSPIMEALIWLALFLLPVMVISLVHPNLNVDRLLEVIASNNARYNELSAPENVVRFKDLQPTPESLLQNAPWAFFQGCSGHFFGRLIMSCDWLQALKIQCFYCSFSPPAFRLNNIKPHRIG